MTADETYRLFIALELPDNVLEALERVQARLKRGLPPQGLRWARSEGLHLTLRFLGDVPAAQVQALNQALTDVAQKHLPFSLKTDRLGCFPSAQRPSVLWVGIGGALEALQALQADVEQAAQAAGFEAEDRSYRPHLTLARIPEKLPRAAQAQFEQSLAGPPPAAATWEAAAISLMRSQINRQGSIYTCLAQHPLGGPPQA